MKISNKLKPISHNWPNHYQYEELISMGHTLEFSRVGAWNWNVEVVTLGRVFGGTSRSRALAAAYSFVKRLDKIRK